MKKILSILLLFIGFSSIAQTKTDTFGVMQYNLLNYRNSTTSCTNNNNNANSKDAWLTTIIDHTLPAIFIGNEIAGDGGTAVSRLLSNALNKNGRDYYKSCNYSANSSLSNMLFYDKRYFALHSQSKVDRNPNNSFIVRQIDVYRLYYLDQSELDAGDTTFLTFYVAHYKAGSSSSDKTERDNATQAVMAYHEDNYTNDNYFMAGDFNIQTSSEAMYQNLIAYSNSSVRFKDPKNRNASWNNNSLYSDLHTQSTHTSAGCHSSGGLDDRFDFILCGQEVLDNTRGVKYISGSYKAVGNDANHFNDALIDGSNTSVPADVLSALYNMSDHLPVYMQIGVSRTTAGISKLAVDYSNWIVANPAQSKLEWKWLGEGEVEEFVVIDAQGKVILSTASRSKDFSVNCAYWQSGVYSASLKLTDGTIIRKKLVFID